LPLDPRRASPTAAVAAQEDPAADYQTIMRRDHDVINFSMVFAAPADTDSRRLRIGSTSPPGWIEFDRWWTELAAGGTDALLGVVRVHQAKCTGQECAPLEALAQQARAILPATEHQPCWWRRGRLGPHGIAVWETTPGDDRPERCLVVLAPGDQELSLSAWTWSNGEVAMPPLARYLMHAAKLRYQARVRGDGHQIAQLRHRIDERVRWLMRTEVPAGHPDEATELRELLLDEKELVLTASDVRDMRHTVRIAIDNMTAALAEPLHTDQALADWITQQLADDAEYLATTRQRAQQTRQFFPIPLPQSPTRIAVRMGFGVDIAGYSTRTAPQKNDAQHRLATLVHQVLSELDLRLEQTDHQPSGDGMIVFLPATVELHLALPRLIQAWTQLLAADNQRFQDRLRLRLATVVGPIGLAALGFSGRTPIEAARLLDSDVLRHALQEHPYIDLAVLISDQLHHYVIDEGHPGLDTTQLQRHLIKIKEYCKHAWLWTPP
ncbi:MAG TPA: CATRA conflict system CASPASE/TPR repeat-associated protein, partial [Pseudonocardiaceae bacterium]|nr:CATRA conflict system CASPASE/TPR repeat-associated protein [Pseudonocardiaceae bacterium]